MRENPRGSVVVGTDDAGSRLDTFVSEQTGLSRNRVQKLIGEGLVLVDGEPARKHHTLARGEAISWEIPPAVDDDVLPQEIPLQVVFEDDHLVVVDKPANMVMYPGPGHSGETLLNALMSHYPDISGVGGKGRSGIFHRLDKGTSGLVAVARSQKAYLAMVEKMKNRLVERTYLALVVGSIPTDAGTIDAPLGRSRGNRKRMSVDQVTGRPALSRFKVVERFAGDFTFVQVSLETGRTHQIRVHFTHIGHPVAGDPEYSRGKSTRQLGLDRQFLHAYRLEFEHPFTGEALHFESRLPGDLEEVLAKLRMRS